MSGDELRRARKSLRLTQAGLAEILGCTRQHVTNLEDRVLVPAHYALAVRHLLAMAKNEAA